MMVPSHLVTGSRFALIRAWVEMILMHSTDKQLDIRVPVLGTNHLQVFSRLSLPIARINGPALRLILP